MATIHTFEEMEIWKKARTLNQTLYSFLSRKEFSKDYKLVNQINGSCGSIMDNIAEGFGRGSRNEFIQFLSFAKGSTYEFMSQMYRALDRNYITKIEFDENYDRADYIGKAIKKLIIYLNSTVHKGEKYKNRV
jgi:four helix bundle protein